MKRTFLHKLVASTVLVGAVLGAASVAQARPNVSVSIDLPGLPLLVPPGLPQPFIRAEPVYVQPRPVYQPVPVVVEERPWQPSYRYESERQREWRHREWQRREWERREWERRHQHQRWDKSPHREHRAWD
jgi:hypothetical protein